jgi:uncharacterized membrane protein YgdD (TMEM256/DUF423 family)
VCGEENQDQGHTYIQMGRRKSLLGKEKKSPEEWRGMGRRRKKNKKEEKRRLPWALFFPPLGPFASRDFFARAVMTDGWGRFLSPLCFFPFYLALLLLLFPRPIPLLPPLRPPPLEREKEKRHHPPPEAFPLVLTTTHLQLVHSAVLLVAAQQSSQLVSSAAGPSAPRPLWLAKSLLTAGMTLFSGSIYLLVLDGERFKALGPVTPVGGLCLIGGWVALGFAASRGRRVGL